MHSLPQFLEVPFTPLFLQRSSIAVPVSNDKRNSSASFNKIAVVEMEVRRTNPGFIGKAKMNTIKMSIAMVGAFLACWTPYYAMCIWWVHSPHTTYILILCNSSTIFPLIVSSLELFSPLNNFRGKNEAKKIYTVKLLYLDAYVLWPLDKMVQNWMVDQSTARDFTVWWKLESPALCVLLAHP